MKSTDKPVRLFRYGRAAAGLILLVNPIISLYDILPDFIGYLLLFTALREVSRLEGRMEDAQSRLIWLAAFSGLRLTLALVFYDAQSSFKLLVCFSLAVVELVTFLMWSASFFSGLEYLLNRNDGEELVGRLSNVRFLTVLFFIVRSACNLLPEFTSLLEDAAMTDLTNAARYLALAGGSRIAEGIRRLRGAGAGRLLAFGHAALYEIGRRRRAVFRRAAPALQRGGLRQSPARPAAAAAQRLLGDHHRRRVLLRLYP